MRVRTAVGVVLAIVVAKAGLTWVVLWGWRSLPEQPGFVGRWQLQLGTVAEWLAAAATAGAVIVALFIAGRDRRQRIAERHDEQKTQARLVRIRVSQNGPNVTVEVRNFGSLPILDVELADATWSEHPDARPATWGEHPDPRPLGQFYLHHPILEPFRNVPEDDYRISPICNYTICFLDATEDRPLLITTQGVQHPAQIKVRFTTANGVRWEITKGTGSGEPVRL